jgi:hypothetical protein
MKEIGRSIIAELASTMDRLSVSVLDFESCGDKGKVKVAVVASENTSKQDVFKAINAQFKGKLRAVARSFKLVESSSSDVNNVRFELQGFVVPNVEIIEASSEEGTKMKAVASNMFMDDQDCIWHKTGDFLYKKSDIETSEELNNFLKECSSSNVRQRKSSGFNTILANAGDFISYLTKGEICCGFVIATDTENQKLMVIAEGEDDPEVIDAFDIQDTATIDEDKVKLPEEDEMVETSSSAIDINAIISYYKRWFQYNPQYANMLIDRLKKHAFC